MSKPQIIYAPRLAPMTRAQRQAYHVEDEDVVRVEGEFVELHDLWVENALPNRPEWTVASRIIGDERGVPVVAEVRLFPTPRVTDHDRPVGEWAAGIAGSRAARPIPRGGISKTMVRLELPQMVRSHGHSAASLRSMLARSTQRAMENFPGWASEASRALAQAVEDAGVAVMENPFAEVQARGTVRRRGRPVKWTVSNVARIALTYDDAIRAGSPPIAAIMERHHLTRAQARNVIARARAKSLIPAAPDRGRLPEGPLPSTMRAALERMIGGPKGARHVQTTRTR